MWTFLKKLYHKLASPPHFYKMAPTFIASLAIPGYLLIAYGVIYGLFFAPVDIVQGERFRMIYVHVPAAYLSMMAYMIMAVAGAIGLIWRMKLAHAVAASSAPIGAAFTFLALATGSIWGASTWGTWWEWGDPRLMSELVLLFLYIGYMALRGAIDDLTRADKASAVLAIVGAVNIPIIHYSVVWWTSLHQGSTLLKEGGGGMQDTAQLYPLLASILGFTLVYGSMLLKRVQTEVLIRERRARWVKERVLSAEQTL